MQKTKDGPPLWTIYCMVRELWQADQSSHGQQAPQALLALSAPPSCSVFQQAIDILDKQRANGPRESAEAVVRQRRSRFALRLRCRYRTASAGIRPLAVVRVLQSRVAELVPTAHKSSPWLLLDKETPHQHGQAGPGASVPWAVRTFRPSQADGNTTCPLPTAPGRPPKPRALQVWAPASQFWPRIPSRKQAPIRPVRVRSDGLRP